jgi:tetratricopeptide (TPR) repeat protein
MRKIVWIISSFALLLVVSVALVQTPMTVTAIDEVTPTPVPDEPAPTPEPTADPDVDVDGLIEEALADIQMGNFQSAITKAEQAMDGDPANDEAYAVRAIANVRLGRGATAVDDMRAAIERAPYTFEYYELSGDINLQLGDEGSALFDYDDAIAINPLSQSAFASRAEAYYQLGDTTAGDTDDFISRGLERLGSGDARGAIEFYELAIEAGGDLLSVANAYYALGISHLNRGDNDEAITAFGDALDVNPQLHNAYLARGISYRESGDIVAAGEDFAERIRILGQETRTADMSIGESYEAQMAYRRVYEIAFDGDAGATVSITARDSNTTTIDPLISLLGPDGTPIAGDDDFGGNLDSAITDFELPADGTYTILLGHAEGGYQFGFEGMVTVTVTAE